MIKQSHLKSFHRRSESQSLHSNKIISPIQSQKHIAILPATLKRKVIKRNMTSDINIIREVFFIIILYVECCIQAKWN